MKPAVFTTVCVFLLTVSVGASQAQPPDPTCLVRYACNGPNNPLAPIQAVIRAANSGSSPSLQRLYTANAVVMDDEAPFRWNGATAGTAWLNAVGNELQRWHLRDFKATAARVEMLQLSSGNAHIVVPTTFTGTASNVMFRETGTFSFVLAHSVSGWKISAQSWTTQNQFSDGHAVLVP